LNYLDELEKGKKEKENTSKDTSNSKENKEESK
jgi:hypothetical protein